MTGHAVAGDTGGRDRHGRLPALAAPQTGRTVDHADEVIEKLEGEIRWLRMVIERLLTDLEVSRASASAAPAGRGQRAVRIKRPPSSDE